MPTLRRLTFLLFFSSLFLGACSVRPGETEPDVVVTLPPEFIVDLYEQREAATGQATFGLWVETVKTDYPAANYRIVSQVESGAGQLRVRLNEVAEPDQPDGAPGPARTFIPLGALADGTYNLSIQLGETLFNEGVLTVGQGHYELVFSEATVGIDVQNRVLNTIPDGSVWGYVLTPTEIQQPAANAFLLNIKNFTEEAGLPAGFYGYFTVAGTGQVFFHRSVAPGGAAQLFVRRLSADPNALRGLLNTYRNDAQTPLTIRCWWTGGEL